MIRRFATSWKSPRTCSNRVFSLGGKRVRASVMFSDIRGFTPLAESQPPEETIELLNTYYTLMFDAIGGHGGIVSQIAGDGLMAIFGAPLPLAGPLRRRGARGAGDDRDDRTVQCRTARDGQAGDSHRHRDRVGRDGRRLHRARTSARRTRASATR